MGGLGGDGDSAKGPGPNNHFRRPGQPGRPNMPISGPDKGPTEEANRLAERAIARSLPGGRERYPDGRGPSGTPPVEGAPPWVEEVIQRVSDRLCRCLLDGMETRMLTGRGAKVRAPETCAQPVSGKDLDQIVRGMSAPSTVGAKAKVLEVIAQEAVVIKAIGWEYAIDPAVSIPVDPANQLKVTICINGTPVGWEPRTGGDPPTGGVRSDGSWRGIPGTISGGLEGLTGAQIYVRKGQTVTMEVERIAPQGGSASIDYAISARWKGWAWTPSINAEGALGVGGF